MFEVDKLSSFFTKLSKNNMGASWGASDASVTPPCYFFLRTKIIFPNA